MTDRATDIPVSTRPWLASYSGLPERLPEGSSDMLRLFQAAVVARRDHEALRYFDAVWTWGLLDQETDAFARVLAEAGVTRGDRIGVVLQNVPHCTMAIIAAWKLGAVPVPGNPMYRSGELAKIFGDFGPRAIVGHDDHAEMIRDALRVAGLASVPVFAVSARARQTVNDDRVLPQASAIPEHAIDLDAALAAAAAEGAMVGADVTASDVGLILYTSGTTGEPKGAVITHGSLAFNARNAALWFGIHADSRILGLAPMFHITGFVLHHCLSIAAGASLAFHYRFEPGVVLDTTRRYQPTFTIGAITVFNALMSHPGACADDFTSLEHVCSGGASIAPALRDAIRDRLGFSVSPVYGMTETTSPTHAAPIGSSVPVDKASGALAIGVPISSTEALIADEDGRSLPPGEAGEIWVRGPQIMRGYLNKPQQTAAALHEGWMRTGDIGVMDKAGWFYIVDRKKDMINASGFKVWPREVEDALYGHPAIREAAVVGFPDPYRGESVCAFVSVKAGLKVEAGELVTHCRELLAAYKIPRRIEFLDDLPKTPTGKIQRASLRDRL